jgi:hypothetical protein
MTKVKVASRRNVTLGVARSRKRADYNDNYILNKATEQERVYI